MQTARNFNVCPAYRPYKIGHTTHDHVMNVAKAMMTRATWRHWSKLLQ